MSTPTLMFCTGATKAGTSWLHRYISNHPECHMRGIKELHYFDALEFQDWKTWIKMVAGRRDTALREAERAKSEAQLINKRRVAHDAQAWLDVLERRAQDDDAYMAYLTEGLSEQRLVGDFTPAYGLLPQRGLRHMAKLVPDVRFVYLLRDPVQRLWSHARMIAGRRAETPDEIPGRAVNIVKRTLRGKEEEIEKRSDYIRPLKRLRAAVDESQIHIAYYEELFNRDAIAELSKFLGISHAWADFDKRILESPKAEMEPGQWEAVREFLAPQYDGVREMLGRVPDLWDKNPG
ncbi:hypothetical protein AIOL_002814 [Candidatus Rhodobacter oscarellae]|uniref:Sulfotransferase n=1 Tax=Candidatus Rhodobacter oscarellae TaxID=1675527 RepID=A0A0J9E531_9RHOB|nr:sulfotransferase [Candidatus Rhodobacter lobularis]KMW57846.1 hypothetical protein AIOL_002814 [Candidatus Rhodobacter lobularis]